MQAAKAAAEAAESAALAAEDGARMASPVEATSKASAAAWRASQAASFEGIAEAEALLAASHAKVAGTAQAVAASMEAAQHYNLVRIGSCLLLSSRADADCQHGRQAQGSHTAVRAAQLARSWRTASNGGCTALTM